MTIKRSLQGTLALIMALFAIVTWSNEVYIEQVGDDSTITITQDGSGNSVGTELNPAYIGGGSNTVTIDQVGTGNSLTMTVNGAGTTVTASATGDNNSQTITCGSTVSASCTASTISSVIVGDSNTTIQDLGTGANHTSSDRKSTRLNSSH